MLGKSLKHVLVLDLLRLTLRLQLDVHIGQLTLGEAVVGVNLQQLEKVQLGRLKVLLPEVRLTTAEDALLVLRVDLQRLVAVLLRVNVLLRLQVAHGQIEVAGEQRLSGAILQLALKLVQQTDKLNDALVLLDGQLEL